MGLDSIAAATSSANNQAANITQQDFLQILLTQLNSQDPLKPMDNTAFVAQLAQFSQLEAVQQLNASTSQLLAVQTAVQSVGLMGHTVSLINGNNFVTGTVSDVSTSGNSPLLTVQPTSGTSVTGITLNQIQDIQ
jgi:flagellar basal-body rod modification protein FlgD